MQFHWSPIYESKVNSLVVTDIALFPPVAKIVFSSLTVLFVEGALKDVSDLALFFVGGEGLEDLALGVVDVLGFHVDDIDLQICHAFSFEVFNYNLVNTKTNRLKVIQKPQAQLL